MSCSGLPQGQVPGPAVRQVHRPLPTGGCLGREVRDSAGRPGPADEHGEEEDLRHRQCPRVSADDDEGKI